MAEGVKISALTETTNITGNEHIIINQDGMTKRTLISKIQGAKNLTEEYVELTADNGEKFRLKVDDQGVLIAYDPEVDTAEAPVPGTENANKAYDGLIINQIYGTGDNSLNQPLTHSFIELYNLNTSPINLKGIYLMYRAKAGSWQSLELKGIVPPKHSFLIRGARVKQDRDASVRIPIVEYDMQWDIKMASTGFSAYLQIGNGNPGDNPVRATYISTEGGETKVDTVNHNYIDMLAGGGSESDDQTVMAYEKFYHMAMNDHTAIMRKDFMHSGEYKPADAAQSGQNKETVGTNKGDSIAVDYKTCDTSKFRPRSLRDGYWYVYATKDTMNEGCPNMLNMCYGKDGNTTRTFTWQSKITNMGMIKYRKQGELKWKTKETTREIVTHTDCEAMVHRVIIHDLEAGVYEYQCGQEGAWSSIETFEVKKYTENDPINVLWVTDNQSWTTEEGKACDTAMQNILATEVDEDGNPNYDFSIHTGDVSQNANRTFEFRDYYTASRINTKNMCHMMTCGNNDLVDKKYSDAWSWYSTAEDQWANSVYAYDLGYAHFVCLNSNTDSTYVVPSGGEEIAGTQEKAGLYADTDAFLEAQADWLDAHLTTVDARKTRPRWVIVYMHLSPFTVSRTKRLQCFVPVFEKHKVPLVICGHNHTSSRSIPLYTGYQKGMDYFDYQTTAGVIKTKKEVEETGMFEGGNTPIVDETGIKHNANKAKGTYYLMTTATGYKLSGKEKAVKLHNDLTAAMYNSNPSIKSDGDGEAFYHDNGSGQPWWYKNDEEGSLYPGAINPPKQPTYGKIEITKDTLKVTMKVIQGVLKTDVNKFITVNDYGIQTIQTYDELTINYSDRDMTIEYTDTTK